MITLKLFGKNTFIYAVGNVGLRAASFLLIPVYTHFLSIGDYGLLATLLITIQIMSIVMSMGMRITLIRFVREYEKKNQAKYLLVTTTFINVVAGVVITCLSVLLLIPFFQIILHSDNVHTLIILICMAGLIQSLNTHFLAYYRSQNKALKFMIIGIASALILFIANFLLLSVFRLGIIGVLLVFIGTYTTIFMFMSFDVLSKTGIGISFRLIPKLIRFGFPLVFSQSGQFVIGGGGIYFLSYFVGLETVAIFSLGFKLSHIVAMTILTPFQLAFNPYVFTNLNSQDIKEKISRLLTYLFLAMTFMSFCVLLGARIVLPLIAPPEYSPAYIIILLLLPAITFRGISYFGETLLSIVNKTSIIGLMVAVAAIISIILNFMLVPVMNWYGTVITYNFSNILVCLTLSIIGIKKFPVPIEWQRISIISILFVSFLSIFYLLQGANNLIFYSVAIFFIIISTLVFYFCSFCNEKEKLILRNGAMKLKSAVSAYGLL